MTTALALPQISVPITIPNDQDWIEGLGYADPVTGAPIALDNLGLAFIVRPALGDPSVIFTASTENGLMQILPAAQGSTVNSVWALVIYMVKDVSGRMRLPDFLTPGSYVYGLQAFDGVNTITIVSGTLTITQGVP